MGREFIFTTSGNISIHKTSQYSTGMEDLLKEIDTNRVVTILKVIDNVVPPRIPHYKIEEFDATWVWTDEMIECSAVPAVPIQDRFEILDL